MDAKEIRELIEIISRSNFTTFELEEEGFRLKLVKADREVSVAGDAARVPAARIQAVPATAAEVPAGNAAEAVAEDDLVELTSPIVGTFYRSPSPDAAPFAEIGDKIGKGQVLCIVEAMKLMNEIESEIDAEVVDVAVASGQPVEYGEVLFRLRPLS